MPTVAGMTAVYDRIGVGYAELRVPDPRIARQIVAALGPGTVLNVGAGTGSYEPDSTVAAVEPSPVMLAQRPASAAPAVRAVAEALPFADQQFDAALAVLTTHHWSDPAKGLDELRRVSRRQVVLTWDQDFWTSRFWVLVDYLPEAADREQDLAALRAVSEHWPDAKVEPVPIPHDCTDGFFAAYWRRPEAYLVPAVRTAISGLALLDQGLVEQAMLRLEQDLADGTWAIRHADLLERGSLDCGYRLVVLGD
ncbi:MAG: methyltransferase type 11 [Frankiales bacterium]|nr:methyltransferase type 11 [Frankiales bacterium]